MRQTTARFTPHSVPLPPATKLDCCVQGPVRWGQTWHKLTVFTRMQGRCLPSIWSLNISGHHKFTHEALQWITPIWIALNWTKLSQTKACIAQSSSEICALVGHYAAQSGNSLRMFWDNLAALFKRSRNQKRWHSMTEANWQPFFWGGGSLFIQCLNFFKEARHYESLLCFRFQAKKHLTWRFLRLDCSQWLLTTGTVMYLITNLVQG